jgi:methylated-DNA-[protein]-cysteine S-methyltransferase
MGSKLAAMPHLGFMTPVGTLTVFEDDGAIVAVEWGRTGGGEAETPLLAEARRQLGAYFARARTAFSLPLRPAGTAFQGRVWALLAAIPYGETRTYGDLAAAMDSGPRAVGAACGRNPIPIIIPCHRVLGADGALAGYSGGAGVATKRALLALEGVRLGGPDLFDNGRKTA